MRVADKHPGTPMEPFRIVLILRSLIAVSALLCYVPSTATAGTSQNQPLSTATPSVNNAALAYGRDGGYSHHDCIEIAKRFDVILSMSDARCRETIKHHNPAAIILAYTNSTNCSAGDSLCTFLQSQKDPEQYFLNFVTNGVQDIDGKTFARRAGERVCAYGTDGWCANNAPGARWTTDYVSPKSRKKIAGFFADPKNLGRYYDGYFFDNMDRGCSYAGTIASGKIDHDLEEVNGGALNANITLEKSCNALRREIDTKLPITMYAVDNISNYGLDQCGGKWWWQDCSNENGKLSRPYPVGVLNGRGALQEFFYRFDDIYQSIASNYDGLREIWKWRGSPANNLYVAWWQSTGGGPVATGSERVQLFALASQLLFQFPAVYMRYDGGNANNDPLQGDWIPAMNVSLGKPLGKRYPIDAARRTYRRDFENGIVVVRFRLKDNENYTDNENYHLKKPVIPVHASGTIDAPVTNITLHNAQGFIGIYSAR